MRRGCNLLSDQEFLDILAVPQCPPGTIFRDRLYVLELDPHQQAQWLGAMRRTCPFVKFYWALTLLLLVPVASWGAGPRHRSTKSSPALDSSYLLALGTANRFLHAWQSGDLETGTVLLSDRVRHSQTAETLEQFFSGGGDRAFEITRGKGHGNRYRFPVVLVTNAGGGSHRLFSEMVLVNTGKSDWAVDKIPE